MSFKALGVGLPKCGTTTLYLALKSAGIDCAHHTPFKRSPPAGLCMEQAMDEGLPMDTYMQGCEAVTHLVFAGKNKHTWPTCNNDFLLQFRKENPNTPIILPTRDLDDMLVSIKRWGDLWDRWRKSAPGLTYDATDSEFSDWVYDYNIRIKKLFLGDEFFMSYDIYDPIARERIELMLGRQITWWGKANEWKPGVK